MGVNAKLRSLYPGKDQVLIVYEGGGAPGTVRTGVDNIAPTEIRSTDHPARSKSLYQLSYPCPIDRISVVYKE